jgi:hypothetical protein
VRGAQAGEIPALHATGKALADGNAANIDELAGDKVIGGDLRADRNQRVLADAKLGKLALGLDLLLSEVTTIGLAHIIYAARPRADLECDIAILIFGTVGNHLALRKAQHRNRHVLAGFGEHPGHTDLLCNYARTHC